MIELAYTQMMEDRAFEQHCEARVKRNTRSHKSMQYHESRMYLGLQNIDYMDADLTSSIQEDNGI